jgi:hypothetical protein
MALIRWLMPFFKYIKMATQRFSLENVKESVLKIRRFAFDRIFSIKNAT